MARSQNGYRANDRSLIASYKIPGGRVSVRKGDVATVLVYVAKRFHSEVEHLKWPGVWGYAERKIRGGSSLSNHASGTALDFNAPDHWLGERNTFSNSQERAIRRILNDCDGVIRWGGDYSGRKDEMHFEINKGTSAVRSLANKIEAGKKPGPSGGATSSGGGGGNSYGDANANHKVGSRIMRKYCGGDDVRWVQKRLYKLGWDNDMDGLFGPTTEKIVEAFQKKAGLTIDGEVGPKTIAALKAASVVRDLPKSKPKHNPKAPSFPFPRGHWMGVESNSSKNHSGYYAKDRPGIKVWQARMKKRGWTIGVDGYFGPQSEKVAKQFQRQVGVRIDGLVGEVTFAKSWTAPIT